MRYQYSEVRVINSIDFKFNYSENRVLQYRLNEYGMWSYEEA